MSWKNRELCNFAKFTSLLRSFAVFETFPCNFVLISFNFMQFSWLLINFHKVLLIFWNCYIFFCILLKFHLTLLFFLNFLRNFASQILKFKFCCFPLVFYSVNFSLLSAIFRFLVYFYVRLPFLIYQSVQRTLKAMNLYCIFYILKKSWNLLEIYNKILNF